MVVDVSLHDVRHALVEVGRLRFGEMKVEDAIREIVHTTHSMFHVDGAGLMLADADQHLRSVAASAPGPGRRSPTTMARSTLHSPNRNGRPALLPHGAASYPSTYGASYIFKASMITQ